MDKKVADRIILGYHTDKGKIINIASQLGKVVIHFPESGYYASKACIIHLTRAFAMEYAPLGIHVNCIAPGIFFPTNIILMIRLKYQK